MAVGGWISGTNCCGGAILELTNCTLSGNSADSDGDGVGTGGGIFSTTAGGPSPVATFVDNSIVWGNGLNPIVDELDAVTTVTYSNVEGGWPGDGNINADPLFLGGSSGTWTANGAYNQDAGQTTCCAAQPTWLCSSSHLARTWK